MARYLSPEWFAALSASGPAPTPSSGELVIEHRVGGGPDGDLRYHVRIGEAGLAVVPGPADAPQVSFSEDYATAALVAEGRLGAAAALLNGQMRVSGDLAALLDWRGRLDGNDPLPAAVRAGTEF